MIQITIQVAHDAPIYRQIVRQIRESTAVGGLKSGDRLPSHRDLAKELAVAPLTVKKAYDELERLGLVETRRGRGTFVVARLPERNPQEQRDEMKATARLLLSQAMLAALTLDDVLEVLSEVEREIRGS
ncbi:MAG TPA: GntR family transcriptional regulator [Bryobacteraceae bacterium]|jgi:GntR family transcriptional regulator|nr:GntR family transcriptional regulator [Bryobacteraceae bacterium]